MKILESLFLSFFVTTIFLLGFSFALGFIFIAAYSIGYLFNFSDGFEFPELLKKTLICFVFVFYFVTTVVLYKNNNELSEIKL